MKKIGIMLAVLVLCAVSASATRISKSKAQAKAVSFFQKGLVKANGAEVKLVKEYASSAEAPAAVFAFSRGENVVFVSAEDKMPSILGYSSNADVNNLPPALEEMLRYYAHLSDAVREGRIEAPKLYASAEPVDSLLHTCWYQEAPFWNLCPESEGYKTADGCVATAFAMIMKYYNWPDKPEGKAPAYTTQRGREIPEEDLQSHTYKWDDMINVYKEGEYTEEQGQAVAQLCYDVAVASKMNFGIEGSGTQYALAAEAMRTYFKYNKGIRLECADWHTEEEWDTMLKNEISQGRPLPFDAQTDTDSPEGHCFVLDGFNAEGLFHVNWGWGGRSDGFFLITSLDPKGETNPNGGFIMRQRTLIDFAPDKKGTSTPSEENIFLKYDNSVRFSNDEISITKICNWGLEDFKGDLILQLVDKDGNVADQRIVLADYDSAVDAERTKVVSIKDFDYSKFADGVYHTEMIAMSAKTKKEYPMKHLKADNRIIVKDGKLKGVFSCAMLEGEITGYENVSFVYPELKLKLKGKVTNVDDIDFLASGALTLVLGIASSETRYFAPDYFYIKQDIKPGETITIEGEITTLVVVSPEKYDKLIVQLGIQNMNGVFTKQEYPFLEFIATGIKDININKVEGKSPAYSLDGKRVGDGYKGIIIKDKKKTLNN